MYRMKNNTKKDSEYRHHIQLKYPGACSQLDLEAVLLFATFPYGMGGPNQKRPCNISKKRIIKQYAQLVMPQFMTTNVTLVLCITYSPGKHHLIPV